VVTIDVGINHGDNWHCHDLRWRVGRRNLAMVVTVLMLAREHAIWLARGRKRRQ
jgi:hypothetical protein